MSDGELATLCRRAAEAPTPENLPHVLAGLDAILDGTAPAAADTVMRRIWALGLGSRLLDCLALDYRHVVGGWASAAHMSDMLARVGSGATESDLPCDKSVHALLVLVASVASQPTARESELESNARIANIQIILNSLLELCRSRPRLACAALNDHLIMGLLISDSDDVREETLAFIADITHDHPDVAVLMDRPRAEELCHELAFHIVKGSAGCTELASQALAYFVTRCPPLCASLLVVKGLCSAFASVARPESTGHIRCIILTMERVKTEITITRAATTIQAAWRGHRERSQLERAVILIPYHQRNSHRSCRRGLLSGFSDCSEHAAQQSIGT